MPKRINEDDLNDIITENYSHIYKHCVIKLSKYKSDVDDVTQEVFKTFLMNWRTLDNTNIKAWLKSTADNKIKEFLRKQNKKLNYEVDFENVCDLLMVPFDDIIDDENNRYNVENIDKICEFIITRLSKSKEQMLFRKVYLEKVPIEDIAKEMRISEDAVKMRIVRLNKKIVIILDEYINKHNL